MKEVVQIKDYNGGLCLVSLRPKKFERNDITLTGSGHLDRLVRESEITDAMTDDNVFKVIALPISNVSDFKGVTIASKDKRILKDSLDAGETYLEIECTEHGYPYQDDRLIIYRASSTLIISNLTPAEALERIKQFNEEYTNNHKLTPGLHESS
jgi:hypothetical protein